MKILIFLLALASLNISAQNVQHPYNYTVVKFNSLTGGPDNYGSLGRNIRWDSSGIIYDQGLWIIGKINGHPHLAMTQWGVKLYSPGPIINNQPASIIHPENFQRYRVYVIDKGSTINDKDYLEWPKDYGAPVDDKGKPVLYNDVTTWAVYNAFDTSGRSFHQHFRDTLPVMPIEVHQLIHGAASQNILNDILFLEYTIINKGNSFLDSAYFGLWSDIDVNWGLTNVPAVDTINQLAYCWNSIDTFQHEPTGAAGYTLLYGPASPSSNDTAIYIGEKKPGYKNLNMTSFHAQAKIWDFILCKMGLSAAETWNIARGLDANGHPIFDTTAGKYTSFPFSGDPINKTGWLFPDINTGGEAGVLFFTGPVNMAPADTQWIMFALVPGKGLTNVDAVIDMKSKAKNLHALDYNTMVKRSWRRPAIPPPQHIPMIYYLDQNYPNPFNSSTTIKFHTALKGFAELKVYDVLGNEIKVLVNRELTAGPHSIDFDSEGLSSGIYFYRFESLGFSETRKMMVLK